MAVETFFLFGFKALDDIIKQIFPPSSTNPLLKILEKIELKQISNQDLIKIIEKFILKYIEVGFQFPDLKFHFLKQFEPAYGRKIILEIKPLPQIAIEFKKDNKLIYVGIASEKEVMEFPEMSISIELLKKYFIEGLDLLRLIAFGEIEINKFHDLNDTVVRALLGLTSAYFLKKEFEELVKKELNSYINSI